LLLQLGLKPRVWNDHDLHCMYSATGLIISCQYPWFLKVMCCKCESNSHNEKSCRVWAIHPFARHCGYTMYMYIMYMAAHMAQQKIGRPIGPLICYNLYPTLEDIYILNSWTCGI
jgi:hypothetical protein